MQQNVIAYIALFVALGGTSYASVKVPELAANQKAAKAGITCGGNCPARRVYWGYIGVTGGPVLVSPGAPNVYQTVVGGVPAHLVHVGLGDWLVKFKSQDMSNCAKFANLTHDRGSANAYGYDHFNPDPYAVRVVTNNAAGQPADLDFVIGVFCGPAEGIQSSPAPPAAGTRLTNR
jgi:hypothetical protein